MSRTRPRRLYVWQARRRPTHLRVSQQVLRHSGDPLTGGANEAVVKMLDEIGDVSRIDEFVAKAKDKNDPFRLMGFGHRVYKNFDPRAKEAGSR